MANKMSICLTMVVAATLLAGATAQSGCTSVLISMSPCLNYITGNSSTPSSQCCSQLASVVRSSPQCLCQVINGNGGSSLGININQTQALALPGACNVQTPSISQCNAASPSDSPAGTPEASRTPSGTGSRTIPSTNDDSSSSDRSSTKLSFSLLAIFLMVASVFRI